MTENHNGDKPKPPPPVEVSFVNRLDRFGKAPVPRAGHGPVGRFITGAALRLSPEQVTPHADETLEPTDATQTSETN